MKMGTAFDRFGEALGFWRLPQEHVDDEPIDLKLQMGDGRKLRDIMMHDRNKKDKSFLFANFERFILELIKRDYGHVDEESRKRFVEMNLMKLFESAQIAFRFTTEEELKKAKEDATKELKKQIGGD